MKNAFTRRSFLATFAAGPLAAAGGAALASADSKPIPIGLEMYSVREELAKDLMGTTEKVCKMGYQCVEYFSPYYQWTTDTAQQVRKALDSFGVKSYSTHNDRVSFTPEGIGKAIELNHILGNRYIVMASPGMPKTEDDWKKVAETLNQANKTMEKEGLRAGYHNHDAEWKPFAGGQRPMDILASNTDPTIMLQLDVGTCVEAGADPVAWVKSHPGRIHSMHLKDWSPKLGYKALFGEGVAPWKQLFAADEKVGGAQYWLIEQEGSQYSEFETVERCLEAYRKLQS